MTEDSTTGPSLVVPPRPRDGDALGDPARLEHLARSGALVAAATADPAWAPVARLARALTGAAVALVDVVTDTHVMVCAADSDPAAGLAVRGGLRAPLSGLPCRWVVHEGRPVRIPDLRADPRTSHDTVAATLGLQSYCGVPLLSGEGHVLASVCVLDTRVREWTDEDVASLEDLAELLGARLALTEERSRAEELLRLHTDVVGGSLSGVVIIDDAGLVQEINPALTTMLGWSREEIVGRRLSETIVPMAERVQHEAGLQRVRDGGPDVVIGLPMTVVATTRDGEQVPVELFITRVTSPSGTRYSGSLRDLRQQTRVQAGLDSVIHAATVAVIEVDARGTVRRTEGHGLLNGVDPVGRGLDELLGGEVSDQLLVEGAAGPSRLDLDALGRSWRASAIPLLPGHGEPTGWVLSLVDISDVRQAQVELERVLRTDRLTGLLNRLGLEREVAHLVAVDPQRALRVTTFRLHGLGETNESFGHDVGDELLRISGERLTTLLPAADDASAARVDAGQFSLVGYADRAVSDDWVGAAAGLLSRPVRVGAVSVVPQVSVGTATYDPAAPGEPDLVVGTGPAVVAELLRRAEVAVHAARRAGQPARDYRRSDDVAARRMVLASNLRDALGATVGGSGPLDLGGRLRLAYQPVVSLPGAAVVAVEALLRWHDDTFGPVPPLEVVDVAEGAGLAVALGDHVMALAVHDAATWWSPEVPVPVMVNLSALQVCQPSLVDSIAGLLGRSGLPGTALHVEVTETAVLQDAELAALVLGRVRDLGVQVYLDDFGTGWSTLERLGDLPLDGLKLDRTFIARSDEPTGLGALHAAVALTRSLGVPLVVEGVETPEQALVVERSGARLAQGYLFSRPVDLPALVDRLRQGSR